MSWWRTIVAVIVGLIASQAVFFLLGVFANRLYPTPPELMDPQTPEATALRVATAAANSLLLVLLGSALGGFAGGIIGGAIARGRAIIAVGIIAGLLSIWGLYSLYVFYPARLWFPLGVLTLFPLFTCLGGFVTTLLPKR